MKRGRRTRLGRRPQREADFNDAIDAMTTEELRAFVREALEHMDGDAHAVFVDTLITRAAKGTSGWRPAGPSRRVVDEVQAFVEAVERVGYADPQDVDDYLRQGTKAFLSGEYGIAREIFGSLLPPLGEGEIYVGQDELADEVLTVDLHACAVQYVASIYRTTPLADRAKALCEAINAAYGVASIWEPIQEMEDAAGAPLPEIDAFLPAWLEHLEQQPQAEGTWEGNRERWLREAVQRVEGTAGLERIARRTKKPEALRAWCRALVGRGDWNEALRAYELAAKLVGEAHQQGEFLDGAALAAQQLGRRDAVKRLERAWLGAPTLVRLLRWLGARDPSAAVVVKRAKAAIKPCPAEECRQLGLLHVLAGDVRAAAAILAKAPGLGWSREGHPGHVLFPVFAGLLGEEIEGRLSTKLTAQLEAAPWDPWDLDREDDAGDAGSVAKPRLHTPSIADLLERVHPAQRLDVRDRACMLDALQAAATRRVEGILGHKRRRYYGHAAGLVACCEELAPAARKQDEVSAWVAGLRRDYSRFYAFQGELKQALASTGP